ncbi:hypothetical protein OG739_18320 [Streptomyces longwoodensis]|uniref:hypothetical protein n=1 Tax=Streptomyces longwoodensis TaxID=68231 RepID=UPI0022593514|nr:hypothetical protein [Streptomyces longwoodensis]MCX4994671.1 hypothetical protein [Streptomyces longwoodensis]WRY89490.1 hypothetical protein OG481_13680 [Streptomyces longwoodensis]WTI46231.1 hypothetical protein OG547_17775 [Streptomyces longwoodensis]WUC59019.1 hypothetical protein OHA09_18875 [Streptomyces longwoodensis]WUC72522.1 hypothetical protein OG416_17745 [Streptomyces longwoodensis]
MRTFHKVVLVSALLGSVTTVGAGTASAQGERGHDVDSVDITQFTECRSHDMNIEVLGSVGALTGLAGNLLNGEGAPGAQRSDLGSDMGCNNRAL